MINCGLGRRVPSTSEPHEGSNIVSKATLLVIQGVDQGSRFELSDDSATIGRGPENSIRILDTEVSRQHAKVLRDNGRFVLQDRGSSNGSFVNGRAIRNHTLEPGDRVQVGRSLLLFNIDEERRVAPAAVTQVDVQQAIAGDPSDSIVGRVEPDAGDTLLKQAGTGDNLQLAATLANLRLLYRISEESVRPSVTLEQLLKNILDLTLKGVDADRGCILLDDPETGEKLVPHAFGFTHGRHDSDRMPVSRSIVDYVLKNGHGVRTSDARTDQRFEHGESILTEGIREAMCVPMPGHYEMLGVLYVDITTPVDHALVDQNPNCFSEDHLRLMAAVGRQAALAVENSRFQSALLRAERMGAIGQTITMLSHHIKNILQGVRGGSYLIDMGLNESKEDLVRQGWTIVEKNQAKISHLVLDMLTFSKERQPELRTASLNEVVGEVVELMQPRAEECKVRFDTMMADEIPDSKFDPDGIHRAALNIVTNAIDAVEGAAGAAVQVQTGFDEEVGQLFIAVTDNGPGIPEDQVGRLFHLFESTKGSRGTGLGLAVSQKIIREHGGDITVNNKPGDGCQFILAWPRMESEDDFADSGTLA